MNTGREYEKYLGKSKIGWWNDYNKKNILEKAVLDRYKNLKYSTCRKKYKKLLYYKLEVELHRLVLEYRKVSYKVSKMLIITKAKLCVL